MGLETVDQLKKRLRLVKIEGRTFYLAEGDLLLSEDQLKRYVSSSEPEPAPPPRAAVKELLGMTENGKVVCWRPGTVLTYCILEGFSVEQHAQLAADMLEAAQDWMDACGVEFKHLSQHDRAKTKAPSVLFSVRPVDTNGDLIAAAFFPNDPPDRREVVIDPSHFTQQTFTRAGVLRHELGHVLGFRHEHIRSKAPAVCPKESMANTIDLSDYDPQSVMHYFCGSVGSRDLTLTTKDVLAAQLVYGLPLSSVKFLDP